MSIHAKATLFAAITASLFLYTNGVAQGIRTGLLTNVIAPGDDAKTIEAFTKLEEIRQTVVTAKPRADLWQTGGQAFPYLQVLADRWDDPRSEAILKQLTNSGPSRIEGELLMQTLAYAAERHLILLQDNREYDGLLKGIDKPEERVSKIRQYFDAHQDLLATKCYGRPNRPIVQKLLAEAEKLKGAEVIDLLVRSQLYGTGHFIQYKNALLDYTKKLGREKAVATPYLFQYIVATGNADALPILEQWLSEEPNEDNALMLTQAIARLPGAQKVLETLTKDPRAKVALWARTVLYGKPLDGEPKRK